MAEISTLRPMIARPSAPLRGAITVPGDKSISHRALMIGAVAVGRTRIEGLLEGEDVLATAAALRNLGVTVSRLDGATYEVAGVGIGALATPDDVLNMGNSGTGARLLIGLLATHPLIAHITGDASLNQRPMLRVIEPLSGMGARFEARAGGRLPLVLTGARLPVPIEYRLPVASAQVKSAILLAGLNAPGMTTVIEPEPTRDHTELMLSHFGAQLKVTTDTDGARRIALIGQPELTARTVRVPGDPSSAAFAAVAALITPGSDITINNIGINPLRIGLYKTLQEMGANITFTNLREDAGEPVADLHVRASRLKGVEVPAARAPSMIDEYPILAVAAACAEGETLMHGLAELRVKESNRLAAITEGLTAIGAEIREAGDSLAITGANGALAGGGPIATHFDHRIAMAFLVAGLSSATPVTVDDGRAIATSFPGFEGLMTGLGADIATLDPAGPADPA
ncbi:MAG: 3-phosphoshikimate 1-carboxyvinyltransferase [Alphaproteobacteria bacterium]|jgi:3-phosphoshikimate 1-carboxyvinyltransferase